MAPKIAPFEATPIETLPGIAAQVRSAFRSQKTKPIEWRIRQLRALYWAIGDNSEALIESCKLDLGKSVFETQVTEIEWCKNDIVFVTKNLEKWAAEEKAPDMPLTNQLMSPIIRKDPLGAVLVIGCWNFPVQLSLGPLIGAIAAGCTAVLKPSEISPHTAMVLKKIVEESLDKDAYVVANGGKDETTVLLNEKWDKIFYTGNATVGTIIAKKAAETLTPVTLELGGRNPAIVTKNTDARLAARRLLWGKFLNAGQVCISQNYIMVDEEIYDAFIEQMKIAMKEFYPQGAKASPDFSRIVSAHHFNRIKKMLDSTKGTIIIGGETDSSENYIEPTVVLVNDEKDSLIADESFGPLMPILKIKNLDEAIRIANEVHSTPLSLYAFGNKQEVAKILNEITSGGATINDALFHASIPTMPFGGVGNSGQGSYRGKASFDTFTHRRAITKTPGWMEKLLDVRYPPYAGKVRPPIPLLSQVDLNTNNLPARQTQQDLPAQAQLQSRRTHNLWSGLLDQLYSRAWWEERKRGCYSLGHAPHYCVWCEEIFGATWWVA
jgi:beta-apo-4'-carotenal oxygenase